MSTETSTSTGTTSTPSTRIGDADRDLAISRLAGHHAEGRLTLAEFDERSTAALAARTRRELDALFVDLPGELPTGSRTAVAPQAPDAARAHQLWREGVLHNWLVFCLVAVVAMAMTGQPWLLAPMVFWGLQVRAARRRSISDPQAFVARREARCRRRRALA